MNAADRSNLLKVLHSRRDAIADSWYQAIKRTSFVSLSATEVRQRLVELTEQAVTLLLTEPLERRRAEAIGASLARLRYVQPEALGRTQEVLACQLVEGLPDEQTVALQPRLAALLGGLAAGFLRQARETILAEQERIHNALITKHKRVEQALRESEETARALLNTPTDIAALIDTRGIILDANETMARRFRRRVDELIGSCVWDLLPPDVSERRKAYVSKVIQSGKPVRFEDEREGIWNDNVVYPVLDARGKVTRVAVLARDITERKWAEKMLHDSEARYRAISELISNFAYAFSVGPDATLVFEWVTESFTRITGFTANAVTERGGWPSVIHPDDMPIAVQHLQVLLTNRPDVSEFRIRTKSGDVRWMRNYGRPVWDEAQARVIRIYGAVQDITEQRQMEQRLLHTERLAAMGRLAAALAHEINNPLQAIRSNLELATDFDLELEEHKKYLRAVHQQVKNLAEVTQPVLNFAKPADDTRYPVHIASLTRQALALVDGRLEHAHVQVTTDFPADLPPVFVAPTQIVQVLLNLMLNAIEAMPDGGHLHVTAGVDGDMLALALTDDGPPIPAGHIERIFEAFFTTKSAGNGLGLPISCSIVQQHGGTISVENLSGDKGVTFTVTLPVARTIEGQEVAL
jgi:PAS domain S-box-containing protein